jgi:hypothetical protein
MRDLLSAFHLQNDQISNAAADDQKRQQQPHGDEGPSRKRVLYTVNDKCGSDGTLPGMIQLLV